MTSKKKRGGRSKHEAGDAASLSPASATEARDAVVQTYFAILLALAVAGALSTGRMVESAERLDFGPARERSVTLAGGAHLTASRAGLDRPASMIEDMLAAAERAEPEIAAEAGRAFNRTMVIARGALTSAGTGMPALVAGSLREDSAAPGSGGIPGISELIGGGTADADRTGGASGESETDPVTKEGLGSDSGSGSGSGPGSGAAPGAATDAIESPTSVTGEGLESSTSLDDSSAALSDSGTAGTSGSSGVTGSRAATERERRLAAAEAGASGEWSPPSGDGPESSDRWTSNSTAREIARIAAQIPDSRPLDSQEPLRVHVAGDSMAQPLGYALQKLVVDEPRVVVTIDFKISTSLIRPDYFDWPARLRETMDPRMGQPGVLPPEVLVFFVGGNENQNMRVGIQEVLLVGTPEWAEAYGGRAAHIMDIAGRGGARVVWIGMPVMRDPAFNAAAERINAQVSTVADARPWVTFVDIWSMFAGPDGEFAPFLHGADGAPVQMRDEDGIHLSGDGTLRVGNVVFRSIGQVWDVRTPTPTATPTSTPNPTETPSSTRTPTSTRTATPSGSRMNTAPPTGSPVIPPGRAVTQAP